MNNKLMNKINPQAWKHGTDSDRRGGGLDCGSWGWDGWRRARGENWDNCNRITIKND